MIRPNAPYNEQQMLERDRIYTDSTTKEGPKRQQQLN